MDESTIYKKLTEVFRNIFDEDNIVLSPTTSAADIPAWDSLKQISIAIAAERAFEIRFKTAELEELQSVGEFVTVIQNKIG